MYCCLTYCRSVLSSINEKELEKLCRAINSSLEDCLDHDLALLASTATVTVMAALRSDIHSSINQEQYEVHESIPHDVMLKMCALAVLASHTLRSLGEFNFIRAALMGVICPPPPPRIRQIH